MKKLLVSLAAMLAVTAAFAMPTYFGGTGGLLLENGKVAEKLTIHSYFYQDKTLVFPNVQLTVPVAALTEKESALDNLEISAAYQNHKNSGNFTAVGAKYVLPLEVEDLSAAIGGTYVDRGEKTIYASGTYNVADFGVDLTAQAAYGFRSKNPYLNIGVEKDFEMLSVGVEYLNYAASFDAYVTSDKVFEGLEVTAGLVNIGKKRSAKFVAGIGYAF